MTKRITDDTSTYVDDRVRPLRVEMSSVEGSPVCTIRFGSSFTLNSVTPGDLMDLAHDLEEFARRAQDLHYTEEEETDDDLDAHDDFYAAIIDKNMKNKESQQELAGDGFDAFYTAHAEALESKTPTPDSQSKVERLMQGTVSAPQTDPMNDPVNW